MKSFQNLINSLGLFSKNNEKKEYFFKKAGANNRYCYIKSDSYKLQVFFN